MEYMDAFERQLATVMQQGGRASLPIDATTIVHSAVTSAPTGRWTVITRRLWGDSTSASTEKGFSMFSALKFIAAAAIVALFGGFLLAGVLTTQQREEVLPAAVTESPSPMTSEAFLSTMVTEEVAPGVFRIINDGYRDVTTRLGSLLGQYAGAAAGYIYPGLRYVIVGDDGVVWRVTGCVAPTSRCARFYRLGQEGAWDVDPLPVSLWGREGQVNAGPDGRLWALTDGGPRVFDEGEWLPDAGGVQGDFDARAVQADGTVWLTSNELCWTGDTSAGCSSWPDVFHGGNYGVAQPVVTDDGIVWLTAIADSDGSISFLRFDGTEWQVVPAPTDYPGDPTSTTHPVGMTPDGGTVWTAGDSFLQHRSLTRLDEQGWTTFTAADGVGTWGGQAGEWNIATDMLMVAPDGSAWVNATVAAYATVAGTTGTRGIRTCDGVARFDGETWQPFLSGSCIADLDFAPDSSAWVVALDRMSQEVSTYVITPEAVATSE